MTHEKLSKWFGIFFAVYWTGLLGFGMWVLFEISFTTGETSTPLYTAAWFGQFALIFQAEEAWMKVIKRG